VVIDVRENDGTVKFELLRRLLADSCVEENRDSESDLGCGRDSTI
jgi:hypothetical protein